MDSSTSLKEQDLPVSREQSSIPSPSPLSTKHHPQNFNPAHAPGSPARIKSEAKPLSKTMVRQRMEALQSHLTVAQRDASSDSLASSSGPAFEDPSDAMLESWQAAGREALGQYDMVIFAGDLNYRVKGTQAGVRKAIEKGLLEVLVSNDQLKIEQQAGRVLQGFYEQEIHFAPTFKMVKGSDEYSLKRIPSYTDRILFLCNAHPSYCTLRPLYYRSVSEVRESDHRPVVGGFELLLNPYSKK